eukprot:TRINITY_DN74483_c0_g1_i1.p1 TRINITY_DN74483_c0_g1~~TRINITY_DN74483_c0_g1_i1.p1  ORF type:complete len:419 (+),score=42.85 TRINITY_DN74483_c0_g1_i1:63-1319(+)
MAVPATVLPLRPDIHASPPVAVATPVVRGSLSHWRTLPNAPFSCGGNSAYHVQRQVSSGAVLQASSSSASYQRFPKSMLSSRPAQSLSTQRIPASGYHTPVRSGVATPSQKAESAWRSSQDQSPQEESFRKRRGEGKSSGGGPTSIDLFGSTPASGTHARRAAAAKERGTGALTARSGARHSPRSERGKLQDEERPTPGRRASASDVQVCLSPFSPRRRGDEARQSAASPPRIRGSGSPSCYPHSPLPADVSPRDQLCLSRQHEVGPARSRSAEPDTGFQRRSGAGRSFGGGPSSIFFGTASADEPLSMREQSKRGRISELPSGHLQDQSAVYDELPTQTRRLRSVDAPPYMSESGRGSRGAEPSPSGLRDPPRSYDDLLTENRHLRFELESTQAELETYRNWYAKLSSSYHNGNGYL